MRIGGFQKLTLVDFPGKVAATVFTQGCNFRCGFCHNPELVDSKLWQEPLSSKEILDYLQDHRGRLQGVVITGGEPTLNQYLPHALRGVGGQFLGHVGDAHAGTSGPSWAARD